MPEQVAERSSGVSKAACHSPEQPALAKPPLGTGVGLDDLQDCLQPQSAHDSLKRFFVVQTMDQWSHKAPSQRSREDSFSWLLAHDVSFAACVSPISFFQILTPFLPGLSVCISPLI